MKAVKTNLGRSLDQPDPSIRFYLFHGHDEASSRALADRLLKGLGAEKLNLTGQAIKADPDGPAGKAAREATISSQPSWPIRCHRRQFHRKQVSGAADHGAVEQLLRVQAELEAIR